MTNQRLGFWSAVALVAIGVGYAVVLALGIARYGAEPIGDPVLAAMELLTLVSAVPIVSLWAAIAVRARPAHRACAGAAMAFAALAAGVTGTLHFVELTGARQLGQSGLVWPSRVYAAELMAWDVFLGLAMLFAAPLFGRVAGETAARRGLAVCGALCLVGAVGPAVGDLRLQLPGVVGYAVVWPVVCVFLARLFAVPADQSAG